MRACMSSDEAGHACMHVKWRGGPCVHACQVARRAMRACMSSGKAGHACMHVKWQGGPCVHA